MFTYFSCFSLDPSEFMIDGKMDTTVDTDNNTISVPDTIKVCDNYLLAFLILSHSLVSVHVQHEIHST